MLKLPIPRGGNPHAQVLCGLSHRCVWLASFWTNPERVASAAFAGRAAIRRTTDAHPGTGAGLSKAQRMEHSYGDHPIGADQRLRTGKADFYSRRNVSVFER